MKLKPSLLLHVVGPVVSAFPMYCILFSTSAHHDMYLHSVLPLSKTFQLIINFHIQ